VAAPLTLAVSSIHMTGDTVALLAGQLRHFVIEGYDARGTRVSTDRAGITSSDPTIATVSETSVIPSRDGVTGWTWQDLSPVIRLVAPGTVTVRVTLDGRSDSITVLVHPRPPDLGVLVVDEFKVVEYHVRCAWACPYLAYAPLLRLREPTGHNTATVVSMEFVLGALTTGVCSGSFVYTPGLSADLNLIDDYLWNNDMIFVSISGQPLPGDVAYAYVVVRDADGSYSRIEATGPVLRGVTNPVLPGPQANYGLSC
jgi:hypothetical protein